MADLTKRWVELRRWEQQANGTWSCHYAIFEFGVREWECKKGCTDGTFSSPEAAEAAALVQAQQIIDSLQTAASCL